MFKIICFGVIVVVEIEGANVLTIELVVGSVEEVVGEIDVEEERGVVKMLVDVDAEVVGASVELGVGKIVKIKVGKTKELVVILEAVEVVTGLAVVEVVTNLVVVLGSVVVVVAFVVEVVVIGNFVVVVANVTLRIFW